MFDFHVSMSGNIDRKELKKIREMIFWYEKTRFHGDSKYNELVEALDAYGIDYRKILSKYRDSEH